jgi:hypothetical protein
MVGDFLSGDRELSFCGSEAAVDVTRDVEISGCGLGSGRLDRALDDEGAFDWHYFAEGDDPAVCEVVEDSARSADSEASTAADLVLRVRAVGVEQREDGR